MYDNDAFARALYRMYNSHSSLTLSQAIDLFLKDLELTDRQSNLVAERQKAVRAKAEASRLINVHETALIGSYKRESQIRPLAGEPTVIDVDCLLILKSTTDVDLKYWNAEDGGTSVLNALELSLKGIQGATVKIDRPSVSIQWSGMKMELTPAYTRKDGGFLIPSLTASSKEWVSTSPIDDADKLTAANKSYNGDLKPLIKAWKCWNRHLGKPVKSFAIESFAYQLSKSGYRGFQFELSWFFDKLADHDGSAVPSPSGIGAKLPLYLHPDMKETARNSATLIRAAFQNQYTNSQLAIKQIALVFGKPFPGA